LKEAYKKNIVLSGLSAGGICWFEYGYSDSMSFYHPKSWNYIRVKGLGLLKGIHCPHFNGQTKGIKRRKNFIDIMKNYSDIGIAIDNHCAMEFINNKIIVMRSKKGSNAYKVYKKRGKVIIEEIQQEKELLPIKTLFKNQ